MNWILRYRRVEPQSLRICNWRYRFMVWLAREVVKVPPGEITPRWLHNIGSVICPIDIGLTRIRCSGYDGINDIYTFGDTKVSGEFLRGLSRDWGFRPSPWFRFIMQNGHVALEQRLSQEDPK